MQARNTKTSIVDDLITKGYIESNTPVPMEDIEYILHSELASFEEKSDTISLEKRAIAFCNIVGENDPNDDPAVLRTAEAKLKTLFANQMQRAKDSNQPQKLLLPMNTGKGHFVLVIGEISPAGAANFELIDSMNVVVKEKEIREFHERENENSYCLRWL